ncbi:MAG: GNAT family N-acetyltransferase [Clostridiales bacterium]|nr:GNAT family N-acetyltransferase [Clostridiales bacterium]
MNYKKNIKIAIADIEHLYQDAGWFAYTNDLDKLQRAFENSSLVVSAWENDELVGVIRVISDNNTIAYIQDILVLESHKRAGIGTKLLSMALEQFKDVRQKVLLTDNTTISKEFYEANGFVPSDKKDCISYVKFD